MCEVEYGKCEICGQEADLRRTYFYYPIHCQCCGCKVNGENCHFVMVRHCDKCVPKVPVWIHPVCLDMCGKEARANIYNMMPIKITGEFIIDDPVIKPE